MLKQLRRSSMLTGSHLSHIRVYDRLLRAPERQRGCHERRELRSASAPPPRASAEARRCRHVAERARAQVPVDLAVEETGLVRLHLRELRVAAAGVTLELLERENRVVLCGTRRTGLAYSNSRTYASCKSRSATFKPWTLTLGPRP